MNTIKIHQGWDQVCDSVRLQARRRLGDQVCEKVSYPVWSAIIYNFNYQVRVQVMERTRDYSKT